jgi:uncharacterized membrane protein (UPF0127 family)
MKINNQAKGILLAEEALLKQTLLQRMKGLLGEKTLASGRGIILRPCNSVHTFFMRFAIDVLFVDKNNRVVKALSRVVPYRLSKIYFRAAYVIELPAGTIAATNTACGDLLQII